MRRLWWAGLGMAALVAGGCSPSKQDVAVVNGKEITKDEVCQRLLQTPTAKQVVQQQILTRLADEAAAKQGIKITDQQVTNALQARKDQFPPGRFEEVNAASGETDATLRENVRFQLELQALSMQGAKVSDADIKKFYDKNAQAFAKPEWKQIGFIITKDADDAKKAINAINAGGDFGTVAAKFMIPQAKQPSQQLQWVGIENGRLVNEQRMPVEQVPGTIASYPPVQAAIKSTAQGKVSAPIAPLPKAPQRVLVYVKSDIQAGKIPLDEVKEAIAYNIANTNNQTKPPAQILEDAARSAKIDIKMDQFKDLAKPEVLVPQQQTGAPGAPAPAPQG